MSYGVPPASDGNRVEAPDPREEAFRRFYGTIERPTSTIHITTYILGRGDVGKMILSLCLRGRPASGVSVRLLAGFRGIVANWQAVPGSIAQGAGPHVAYFMPVLHLPFRGRANLRNHRKIVVVDSRIALSGGMNLAKSYMGPTPDSRCWVDLSVVVEGPAVADLESLFFSDWAFATGVTLTAPARSPSASDEALEPAQSALQPGTGMVQVVASGPDVPDDPLYESLVSSSSRPPADLDRDSLFRTRRDAGPSLEPRGATGSGRAADRPRQIQPPLRRPGTRKLPSRICTRQGARSSLPAGHAARKAVILDHQLAVIGSANMDNRASSSTTKLRFSFTPQSR